MAWLVVALAILGFVLLAIEVIIPGLIVGMFGLLSLFAAVVIAYWEFGFEIGSLCLAAIILATSAGFVLWLYLFPRSFIGRRLMLKSASGGDLPHAASPNASLVGEIGVALTHLRPSGTARIAGRRIDVVAEGGYVAENQDVKVVSADGMRVVVRAVEG